MTYAPPAQVSHLVEKYWAAQWDLTGQAAHVTELLSDPCVHLAFERGGPHAGGRLVGVWTRLWRRRLEGRGHVRAVKLRAGALAALTPTPVHRFSNRIVPLESVFGDEARELLESVLHPDDDHPAFALLTDWLSHRFVASELETVARAINLVQRIAEDPELTSVQALCQVADLGPRAMQRLFRDYVGASPKWVIRRNRLQEAALRIERGESQSLAALAADLGYTDQAHLARDFKSATGKTPSEFRLSVERDMRPSSTRWGDR